MRQVLALLLLPLLAGCLAQPGTGEEEHEPTPEADRRLAFLLEPPRLIAPIPNNQAEAALSVSADGNTILTCFHGFFSEVSPGYASTDGGSTWRRMEFPPEAGVGGDCETAITDSGVWVFLASTVVGATVLVSQDNGTTWTFNPVTAIPVNGLADRPWIEAFGEELWLAYMPLLVQPGTVGFVKSTDHGQTWTVPVLVGLPSQEEVTVQHGHFAIDGDRMLLPMVRYFPTRNAVAQIASSSDGETWTVTDVLQSSQISTDWPSLARSEAGDLFFAVTADTGTGSGTHVLHKAPGGQWSDLIEVNAGATWPWIAGGHGHNATFIGHGNGLNDTTGMWLGRIDGATRVVTLHWAHKGSGVEFASVDHDAEGNAYGVWVQAGEGQMFVQGLLHPRGTHPESNRAS